MKAQRLWPVHFGLRAQMWLVLAAAVVFAVFESRGHVLYAREARLEFERQWEGWKLGVVSSDDIINASQTY
jgi:hypothetical protein